MTWGGRMTLEGLTPRVFALPPGVPFARRFAEGVHIRFADPLSVARTLVLVGTRRAQRVIEQALADTAPAPGLLPRVELMSELYADPLAVDLPPAIARMRRQLRLTRLVERFLAAEPLAPASCAADLAESLAELIERFHEEGIAPGGLDRLLEGAGLGDGPAAHWDRTLRFVDIVRREWPRICAEAEGGAPDPGARQRAAIEATIAEWRAHPPAHPVIAAASTGSAGSTAELMAAIAGLPQGAVVLPGFDPGIEPAIWEAAGPDHPAGIFRPLLDRLSLAPAAVRPWAEAAPDPRRALLEQALRPAPVTDHWHEKADELRQGVAAATEGLTLIEADSLRHEAEAIAVAIREALEASGATVGLVSPDAALARRVTAALARFDIVPDDTLGRPLALSPPAVLLRLVAQVAASGADAVAIAALLQHPLVQPGMARREHLRHARHYEVAVLRGVVARTPAGRLPAWPDPTEREMARTGWRETRAARAAWLAAVEAALAPLAGALARGAALSAVVAALRGAAEALSDAGEGPEVWTEKPGERLAEFFAELEAAADAFGDGPAGDLPALLMGLMRGETLRPAPQQPHPRVAIWGQREARVQGADLVILAGLNDGVWPAAADPGPWLSRPMCASLGLPLPERSVGLAAHDFLQAACQPRVILTRARKIDGTPTVASRWLIRLDTLVEGIGAEAEAGAMRARGARYLALARRLASPEAPEPPAPRPAPVPPPEARPRRLSVTRIETLIRDAYAIYASEVLKLRPLDPLGRPPDARERGTLVHDMMVRFTERTAPWPGAGAARELLMQAVDEVLAEAVPWSDLRRIWRARIERSADWFVATEEARRANGTPVAREVRGRLEIDLPGGAFSITAQADRIDRLNAGGAAIYDYKTGKPPSEKQIAAGFYQQLHLQAAILAQGGFDGLPAMDTTCGGYIGLTGSKKGGDEVILDVKPDEIAERLEGVRTLLAAYDTGAPFTAMGRPEMARDGGDYDHLARRREWWGEGE